MSIFIRERERERVCVCDKVLLCHGVANLIRLTLDTCTCIIPGSYDLNLKLNYILTITAKMMTLPTFSKNVLS